MSAPDKKQRLRTAIVAALEREVHPLIRNWKPRDQNYEDRRFRFFEHGDTVLVCAGIGPEPARRAAQAAIALYSPLQIYSVGFAGATNESPRVGDILIPRKIINARDGSSTDTGQGEGTLVTFAEIATPEQKAKLATSFNAQAIDMEAAAVAHAAQARGIRFAAVKAISDAHDFAFPPMETFIDPAGQFHARRFALYLMLRPWLWNTAIRLARNSALAARSLSRQLKYVIESQSEQPAPHPTSMETLHPR